MGPTEIKKILNDRLKVFYIACALFLSIFSYLIIVRYDINNFYKTANSLREADYNLGVLKAIAQYKDYIKQFNSQFAVDNGANWLIDVISRAAAKESITLDLVRPLDSRIVSGYKNISIGVEGRAPYHNLTRFVADLENNERYVLIEDFSFASERSLADSSAGGQVVAAFKLVATCFTAER